MSEAPAALPSRLKAAREARGLSLRGLGKLAKVPYANIHRFENGVNGPSVKTLWRLCVALDVSPNEMLGWGE